MGEYPSYRKLTFYCFLQLEMMRDILLQNASDDDIVDAAELAVPHNRANRWQKGTLDNCDVDSDTGKFDLFSAIASKKYVSKMQQSEIWDSFVRVMAPDSKTYKTYRLTKEKGMPAVRQDIFLKDRVTGQVHVFSSKRFPRKKYQRKRYDILAIFFHTKINELASFHLNLHNGSEAHAIGEAVANRTLGVTMGIDGVPHSVSSTKKMTCMALQFDNCQLVYNYAVLIRAREFDMEQDLLLTRFVDDFTDEGCRCRLKLLIMDMPMRAFVLNMKQFNAHYGNAIVNLVAVY